MNRPQVLRPGQSIDLRALELSPEEEVTLEAHARFAAGIVEELSEAPEAALAELARCALATWDILRDPARSPDDAYADCARWWAGITRAVASLHGATPDPRIGRGLEAVLRGPYDCWFLPTPERHTGSSSEAACFADHALALLEHHADAGTAARLDHLADTLLLEADCNGAEAARRVHLLAQRLRARFADSAPAALKAGDTPRG